jgi:hypothetical protein
MKMVRIRFPDRATEINALGWLAGRFSFKTWSNGETMLSEVALPHLTHEGIPYTVVGPATYEHQLPTLRNPPATAV